MAPRKSPSIRFILAAWSGLLLSPGLRADVDLYLLNVPDYSWYAGCYGTANGNLFGYWDRNGFPDFYTGPTANGVAPMRDGGLDENGNPNSGIRSLWASKAGMDGRPLDQPGHIDDYWAVYSSDFNYSYESTADDPYLVAGRPEHAPDCVGDFIGLSQKKWTNMNGECDGNIDAYSFVYWDATGARRVNYAPPPDAGLPAVDIQSGLQAWTRHRGYEAEVFTQLAEFNPHTPPGAGFTLEDLKHEITNGYPVMVFLQDYNVFSRSMARPDPMPKANPDIHAMLIYGYFEDEYGALMRCRTSWASGDFYFRDWSSFPWVDFPSSPPVQLSVRGVIGYRPKPRMVSLDREGDEVRLAWHGPSARLYDNLAGKARDLHYYIVECAPSLPATEEDWIRITAPSTNQTAVISANGATSAFYRVRLLEP